MRRGTNRRKRRGWVVEVVLKIHHWKACRSCVGVYSGLTQPKWWQRCVRALPNEPNRVSSGKAEKKCEKILKDQSSGEAKHSTLRCRKIANSERKVTPMLFRKVPNVLGDCCGE